MTSFADRSSRGRIALAFAAVLLVAPCAARPGAASAAPEGAAGERIAAEIATHWNIAPGEVRWTATPGAFDDLAPGDSLRLVGRGDDGWMVAVVRGGGGGTRAVRLRAGRAATVAVAARMLPTGATLGADDIAFRDDTAWGPPTAPTPVPEAGWQVRRAVPVGERLAAPAVLPPALIVPGQPLRLTWQRGDVRLSLEGIALTRAARGDPLRVRVPGRGAPVTAVALSSSEARLAGGDQP